MRRSLPAFVCVVLTATAFLAAPALASAAVVPVDPGPTAAGKPIWGTGQNLPPLITTGNYFVGPGFGDEVIDYYDSGQAAKDQKAVAEAADDWVDAWIDDHCGGRPQTCKATVVFDIDETLLSNYGFYKSTGFTFDQAGWNEFTESCRTSAIGPVRALYTHFKKSGLRMVLLTGRSYTVREATAACLTKRGITGWDKLILRSANQQSLSADAYKSGERQQLQRAGWRIVASVGDQVSDMSRGHLKAGFLLPNPMYLIP